MSAPPVHVVLGSASPARLTTLRAAGVNPEVLVSGVDEDGVTAETPEHLAGVLATMKGDEVAARVAAELVSGARSSDTTVVVLGADSVLEFEGQPMGKPGTAAIAKERWQRMRGRDGVLYTGHRIVLLAADGTLQRATTKVAGTRVWHAEVSDAEIDAYIATGEPLLVAGGFTIDGLGGPFIERIEGDHHNVVGLSLPLLRRTLAESGITWHQLRNDGFRG